MNNLWYKAFSIMLFVYCIGVYIYQQNFPEVNLGFQHVSVKCNIKDKFSLLKKVVYPINNANYRILPYNK